MRRVPPPAAGVHWAVPGRRLLSEREVRATVAAALEHGGRPGLRVEVVFVADRALARLHARHLGDARPTDVITFDLTGGAGAEAELYVSVQRARAEARARGLAPERELALYLVHGCLHLCGFDDRAPRARARMRRAEAEVLGRLGYAPEPGRARSGRTRTRSARGIPRRAPG
ncbi:MAG TPA: rRNA maturation RNase YbeY [Planctomycetota bacterium]